MYDIQNALRRRAMAERLEALNRADEATSRASEISDVPIGPRHRAQPGGSSRSAYAAAHPEPSPSPDVAPSAPSVPSVPSIQSAQDDAPPAHDTSRDTTPAAHEAPERPHAELRAEPHPDRPGETRLDLTEPVSSLREPGVVTLPPPQPSAPVTPAAPFPSMLTPPSGFTPSPYTTAPHGMTTTVSPYVATTPSADERTTVTGGPGGGTVVEERPRTDTLLSVRGVDQTARLDVTSLRTDTAAPPPVRGETEIAVPSGVTLLRGPLSLPAEEPAVLDAAPLVVAAPAAPDTTESASPTAPADDVAADDIAVGDAESDGDQAEADEPLNGSSAATIADLLRHGNSRRLFFDR